MADVPDLKPPLMRPVSSVGLSDIFEKLCNSLENMIDPMNLDENSSSMFINCATHTPNIMSLRAEKIELMNEIADLASTNISPDIQTEKENELLDAKDKICEKENELMRANAAVKYQGGVIEKLYDQKNRLEEKLYDARNLLEEKLYDEKKRLEAMVELANECDVAEDQDLDKLTTIRSSRLYAEEVTKMLKEENAMLRKSMKMLKSKNPCKWWSMEATKEWVEKYTELKEENVDLKKWRACKELLRENHGELESFLDTLLCKVCYDNSISTLLPCGHACLCVECAEEISKKNKPRCPLCRAKFKRSTIRTIKI